MMTDYLFVYGTLRQNSQHEMAFFLRRYAYFVGNATYQGKLYRVDYYPAVVPSDNPNVRVQGEVYQLSDVENVLLALDDYEECGNSFPEPTEYSRCQQKVTLETGQNLVAWIYLFNRLTDGLQLIESGDFYKH